MRESRGDVNRKCQYKVIDIKKLDESRFIWEEYNRENLSNV